MAALALSVPDRSTRLITEVEVDPDKVEKWLASLPLLNLAAGGQKLYSTLKIYNRVELDAPLRLRLLELYRVPIQHISLELQKIYVGLPLPLPDKPKGAAEQHREFHFELAYGYKHVVLARTGAPDPTTPAAAPTPHDLALPLQRAIRHLTEVLLASYLSYAPQSLHLWHEIHLLYAHAERLGVTQLEVDDPLNSAHVKSSVSAAYKHALLLDLGDPYHLPARTIVKINQYLESYAALASLHRSFERVEPTCHFLIDLDSDRAGALYSNDMVPEQPERYCLLNTVDLARHIHLQLKHMQDGQPPPCAHLPPDFYKNGGEEMLLRLINAWGVNPKRAFRRSHRTNTKIEVAIGLDAICYWLRGARRFVLSAELFGPFQQRTQVGAFAKVHDEAKSASDFEYTPWDIYDESAGGMSLGKTSGVLHRRVRVGDLIATRSGRDDAWTISAVRWLKSANPSSVEIGTQRLAPSAVPVVVKIVSDTNEESDFLPALLLPPIPALKEPLTLVAPRNVFRPERVIYMDDGTRLHRLIAHRLIDVTNGFERIAFVNETPVAPTG
jgi:hypothetical protein